MNYISERVAYLRGLAEGLKVSDTTSEGKLILKIIDVLEDIADAISELDESQAELDEYVEDIDEDLSAVEEQLYGEEDEGADFMEIECPKCGEKVYFDSATLEKVELICTECNNQIIEEDN